MKRLDLEVLGSRHAIQVPDAVWLDFLERMWRPFLAPAPDAAAPATTFEIRSDPNWAWVLLEEGNHQFAGADRWRIASELRYWIVHRALAAASGLAFVHAAVLARGEEGVLLVGRSGGGKTTLSLALAEYGWEYLSDDLAAIDREHHTVEPVPVPAGIKDPGRWAELRRLWDGADPPEPSGEFLVPVSGLLTRSSTKVRPAVIFLIDFEPGAAAGVEPLSVAQGLTELAQHAVGITPAGLGDYLAICRSARSARLRYGSTEDAIAAAEAFCAAN